MNPPPAPATREDGLQVFYRITAPTIFKLCDLVCGSLEKQHTAKAEALRGNILAAPLF